MEEQLTRRPEPGVRGEVLSGKFTRMFELEAGDPDDFVDQVAQDLHEFFRGALSFTPKGGQPGDAEQEPAHLAPEDGILEDSYVSATADQITWFGVTRGKDGKVSGFRLRDTGMPYVAEPQIPRFGLPALDTNRDGALSVAFSADQGIARVSVTGLNPGALVTFAVGYLRGIKAGQETPR